MKMINAAICNIILGVTERVKKGFFKLVRRLPYLKDRVRDIYICPPIHKNYVYIALHFVHTCINNMFVVSNRASMIAD